MKHRAKPSTASSIDSIKMKLKTAAQYDIETPPREDFLNMNRFGHNLFGSNKKGGLEKKNRKTLVLALLVVLSFLYLTTMHYQNIVVRDRAYDFTPLPPGSEGLVGAYFVGHDHTDTDSVVAAIGAAYLFDGVPLSASKLNDETRFVLEYFAVPFPQLFASVETIEKLVILDVNQLSQVPKGVDTSTVVGIIDHHAVQSGTITTDQPIYMDIKPWGSCSTIVAHYFLQHRQLQSMPYHIAGVLLGAILSDTLNLRSPTTTAKDREVVQILSEYTGIDPDAFSKEMFLAKSKGVLTMEAHDLVCKDYKIFKIEEIQFGYAVIETASVKELMRDRRAEIVQQLAEIKKADGVDLAFIAVVDVLNLRSTLLFPSPDEAKLASVAYKESLDGQLMRLPGRVSRKKQFVPPLSAALRKGWRPSSPPLFAPSFSGRGCRSD